MASPYAIWMKYKRFSIEMQKTARIADRLIAQCVIAGMSNHGIISDLESTIQASRKAIRLITLVENKTLGLRLSRDGNDLDIMAPLGTPDDAIVGMFGFPFLIIAAGVVVIAGLLTAAIASMARSSEIEKQAKKLVSEADRILSSDPEKAKEWEEKKKTAGWYENQSIIDKLSQGLFSFGSKIGWALAIGIGAWFAIQAIKD